MTRGEKVWSACAMLLSAVLLAGCTEKEAQTSPQPDPDTPPPVLEAEWSIPGLNSNPESVGTHHWMNYQANTSGFGRAASSSPGPTLLVDTRTGRTHAPQVDPERFPCLMPTRISDDGIVPILWSTYRADPMSGSYRTENCDRITVLDAGTGKTLWRDDALDLSSLAIERAVGANERTIAVVDDRGDSKCFAARTGTPQPTDDASCVSLSERLTNADLPPLVDADGTAVPLPFNNATSGTPAEIGRTDNVLLVRDSVEIEGKEDAMTLTPVVRAHDLETGETLWEDNDLTPDAHGDDAWSRDETYFIAPSGVVRVSYEHPEDVEASTRTPMILTAVDPRTGKDLTPVARINGAWFNHQFGDMTVALTNQDYLLQSKISGFILPTW